MQNKAPTAEQWHKPDYNYGFKMKVVDEIQNGLISKNFAAKKYLVARSTIEYWCKKLGKPMAKENHSLQKELKRLKDRVEELELIKDIQQDMIAEYSNIVGRETTKKLLPKPLIEELLRKGKLK